MSVDELAVMDGGKCLLQIRGVRPFLSRKYDITKHPNYKYLSDFDEKNAFDIEKYLSTRLPVRPGELYPTMRSRRKNWQHRQPRKTPPYHFLIIWRAFIYPLERRRLLRIRDSPLKIE